MKRIDSTFLQKIPLFAGLTESKLLELKEIMEERIVDAGTTIIKEGEIGTDMFILLNGEVEVSRSLLLKVAGHGLNQGDKSLIRLTADDHAFFGEMALFVEKSERSASVVARTNCSLAVISQQSFFQLTESDHEIGYHVLKNIVRIVSTRLEKTTKDVLKLTTALSLALER